MAQISATPIASNYIRRRGGAMLRSDLRERLIQFCIELGATKAWFDLSKRHPILQGSDSRGRRFSVEISEDYATWSDALDLLSLAEPEDAGLRRYVRRTRGKTWRPAAMRPVRFGEYLGDQPGHSAQIVSVDWRKVPNFLSDEEYRKQLCIPQYGGRRMAA